MPKCGVTEAMCVCDVEGTHEVHECSDREDCKGQWKYDAEGELVPVVYPGGYADLIEALLAMLGGR